MVREHAYDPVMDRRHFSVAIGSPSELPSQLGLPEGDFACLVAWDARGESAETISSPVAPLLRAGASHVVCWGPDCKRVHDITDELASNPDNEFGIPKDSCIMTTWHSSEASRVALWLFLMNSFSEEHYHDSTHVALAIAVGSPPWALEIREALDYPREFMENGSEDGAA